MEQPDLGPKNTANSFISPISMAIINLSHLWHFGPLAVAVAAAAAFAVCRCCRWWLWNHTVLYIFFYSIPSFAGLFIIFHDTLFLTASRSGKSLRWKRADPPFFALPSYEPAKCATPLPHHLTNQRLGSNWDVLIVHAPPMLDPNENEIPLQWIPPQPTPPPTLAQPCLSLLSFLCRGYIFIVVVVVVDFWRWASERFSPLSWSSSCKPRVSKAGYIYT